MEPPAPVALICDLADANNLYCRNASDPPFPVLTAFGGEPLHACELRGAWDYERAVAENAGALTRSVHHHPAEMSPKWQDLLFQFGPREFLYADVSKAVGYAGTHAGAEQVVTRFNDAYRKPPAPAGGTFQLIMRDGSDIDCESVPLGADTLLADASLALHYRPDTVAWHRGYLEKLRVRPHGLSILEGSPGTGKTSYLRHLMGALKDSHRFYFIPTSTMGILSLPEFIGFWSSQRRTHAERRFVVILEDSDAALMTRETDNREQVSAILNLSDGMLADFLRLQVICTINCAASDIDQALLRPGRLVSHHVFERLDRAQATRLSESLGTTLPPGEDFSLAEVFAGHEAPRTGRTRVGFGG